TLVILANRDRQWLLDAQRATGHASGSDVPYRSLRNRTCWRSATSAVVTATDCRQRHAPSPALTQPAVGCGMSFVALLRHGASSSGARTAQEAALGRGAAGMHRFHRIYRRDRSSTRSRRRPP